MPDIDNWAQAIESSRLARIVQQSAWLYPVIEIVHIVGFVFLVGTAIMFDFRLLGLSRNISVKELSNHLFPWSRASLLLILPSGILLFSANAVSLVNNSIFWIKLALIALAAINALLFHQITYKSVSLWDRNCRTPKEARYMAIASVLLWLTIISCGRLLAY